MKTFSIEQLAEKLNGKLWVKGDLKRIYLDAGYNTKKMRTKTYVYEKDDRFIVNCTIECPSQPDEWIESQQNEIIDSYSSKISEIIEEYGFEVENPMIAIEVEFASERQIQGYYMKWDIVRVPINSYGKLAARNRQLVITFKGSESLAPNGFLELNDDDFAIAVEKEKKSITYGYGEEPNLIGEAQRQADLQAAYKKVEEERAARKLSEDARKKEDEAKADAELIEKIKSLKAQGITEPLQLWKASGYYHPAPAEVMQAKISSGLNWKNFQATI